MDAQDSSFNDLLRKAIEVPGVGYQRLSEAMKGLPERVRPAGESTSGSTLNRIARGVAVREPSEALRKWILAGLEKLTGEKLNAEIRKELLAAPFIPAHDSGDAIRQQQTLTEFVARVEKHSTISGLYGPHGPLAQRESQPLALIYTLIVHADCTMRFCFRPYSAAEWSAEADPPWQSVIDTVLWMTVLAQIRVKDKTFDEYRGSIDFRQGNIDAEIDDVAACADELRNTLPRMKLDQSILSKILRRVAVFCPDPITGPKGPLYPDVATLFLAEPPATRRGAASGAIWVETDDGPPTALRSEARLKEFFAALQAEPNARKRIESADIMKRADQWGIDSPPIGRQSKDK